MPTWYHLTDDPDFALDPAVVPKNLNDNDLGPGIFLTKRPEEWAFDQPVGVDDEWSGDRLYVAEIDAPHAVYRLPGAWYDPDATRPGEILGSEETFVPADQFHHLTVVRVRRRQR